jgi:hypothetical protein
MEKKMKKCPNCGSNEGYSQVYTNVTIRIPFEGFTDYITDVEDVYLHEEGDKIDYDYTHSDISYRCDACNWIIPVDLVEDAISWIKGETENG